MRHDWTYVSCLKSEKVVREIFRWHSFHHDDGFENTQVSIAVAILLTRKLLLHTAVGMGSSFDPSCFVEHGSETLPTMRKLWRMIEHCSSLSSLGWAGEAGAMAVTAETLGLGISSSDQTQQKSLGDRAGLVHSSDLDSGLLLPVAGTSQLLNSVIAKDGSKSGDKQVLPLLYAAEVALCSGGGGSVTSFLQPSLQSAVARSSEFQDVLLASVYRSVRLLAVVEYDGDDADQRSHVEVGCRD